MTTLSAAAAANSTVSITVASGDSPLPFSATSSLAVSRENARIDVTGFGSGSRTIIAGLAEVVEVTFSTYADVMLKAGDALHLVDIGFASGAAVNGSGVVMSASYSGDVDGAVVHEYTVIINSPTWT